MTTSSSAPAFAMPQLSPVGEAKKDLSAGITGEYLTNYLKEMDGDDTQFNDISASVIPLSTGTSPGRLPPHEYILKMEQQKGSRPGSAESESKGPPARKPKLDVPFCM